LLNEKKECSKVQNDAIFDRFHFKKWKNKIKFIKSYLKKKKKKLEIVI